MFCDYFKIDVSNKNFWIKNLTTYQINNGGMDEL